MATLLGIGAFARAAGIPASALRFYDEIGLLPAAHVDPANSYRYYDPAQQARARLVAELRGLDVPLDDMRAILDATPADRDALLERLADECLQRAEHRARGLRALRRGTTTDAVTRPLAVSVDAVALADAIRAAAVFTGDQPLDGILLMATPDGVRCLATDRYRLADHHVPGHASGRLTRVLASRHVDATLAVLTDTAASGSIVMGDALVVDRVAIPLDNTVAFPDLPSLADAYAGDAGRPVPVRDTWSRAEGPVTTMSLGSVEVRYTTNLLDTAAKALGNADIMIAATHPDTPSVLTSARAPGRRIILMPRTA